MQVGVFQNAYILDFRSGKKYSRSCAYVSKTLTFSPLPGGDSSERQQNPLPTTRNEMASLCLLRWP